MCKNSLKKIRESLLMSKSELAREANVSPITITRIEQGMPFRMETKRKILLALGFKLSDLLIKSDSRIFFKEFLLIYYRLQNGWFKN